MLSVRPTFQHVHRLSVVACAGLAASSFGAITWDPVAFSGPGVGLATPANLGPNQGSAIFTMPSTTGFTWQSQVSNQGIVSFRGVSSAGTSATSGNGIWYRDTHAGSPVNTVTAFGGTSEPGGATYGPTGYVNRSSQSGNLVTSHSAGGGIATGPVGGALGRMAFGLDTAPGTGGATYLATGAFSTTAVGIYTNNSNQVLHYGSMTVGSGSPAVNSAANTANNTGLWLGASGPNPLNTSSSLALRQGQDVSALFARPVGATGTLTVGSLSNGTTAALNDHGRFAVLAGIQSPDAASDLVTTGTGTDNLRNDSAIYSTRSGSLQAVARRDTIAPDANGSPSANYYGTISSSFIGFNNNDRIAFQTRLVSISGATVTAVNAAVLYSDHDNNTGTIKEMARATQAFSTLQGGGVFAVGDTSHTTPLSQFSGKSFGASFVTRIGADNSLYVNASGFGGTGGTATAGVLRRDTNGYWSALYVGGDVAIPGGASDGSDIRFAALTGASFALNSAGQVAFTANLTGTGVNAGNRNGVALMATGLDGALQMVARLGDFWDVYGDGTDFRQIVGINSVSGGPEDGTGTCFNANGDLVFELQFGNPNIGQPNPIVDSSGVYIAHIPTPGAVSMLALVGMSVGARRRRHR